MEERFRLRHVVQPVREAPRQVGFNPPAILLTPQTQSTGNSTLLCEVITFAHLRPFSLYNLQNIIIEFVLL